MHMPQRMNLKHQNILELLGVTQGYITCLVMPSMQRRSIQVCMHALHDTLGTPR